MQFVVRVNILGEARKYKQKMFKSLNESQAEAFWKDKGFLI